MNRIVKQKGDKFYIVDAETGEIINELTDDREVVINVTDKKSIEYLKNLVINKDNFVKKYKSGIDYEILDKMNKTDYKVLECLTRHIGNSNNICMYSSGVVLKPKHIIAEIRWL